MEPTYHVNYRAGWMEPANEYIPEIMQQSIFVVTIPWKSVLKQGKLKAWA